MPLLRAEPLITPDDWTVLQRRLDELSLSRRRSDTPSLLLNVAYCADCHSPLYRWSKYNTRRRRDGTTYKDGPYVYYRCKRSYNRARQRKDCFAKLINSDALDTLVSEWVASKYDVPEFASTVIPGDNHDAEIAAINDAMTNLTGKLTREAISDSDYDTKMQALRAERNRLRALPAEPDRTDWRETGRTLAEAWEAMDAAQRRAWLLSHDVKVFAGRNDSGDLYAIVDARGIHGLKSIDEIGNLPGPTLLERAKAKGLDKLVDAEAEADDWEDI